MALVQAVHSGFAFTTQRRRLRAKLPSYAFSTRRILHLKLLARLFQLIYSIEPRSSRLQLKMDFGEFPPAPLRCAENRGTWYLVTVGGIGQIYQDFKVFHGFVEGIQKKDISSVDRDVQSMEQFQFARRTIQEIDSLFPRLKPVVVWLMPILLAVRPCFTRSAGMRKRDGVSGYFNALRPDNIVVRSALRHAVSDAAVASHEHIHLLQHRDGEVHSQGLASPSSLLSDKAAAIPQLHNWFEKKEVEARLHESVLSYYRSSGRLPTTVREFLVFLASSKSFGWLVVGFLNGHSELAVDPEQPFTERELEFGRQLETILLSLRTEELERRFITEVMTVMYGNLLRYYGDHRASAEFLRQIPRPNLYDEIYRTQHAGGGTTGSAMTSTANASPVQEASSIEATQAAVPQLQSHQAAASPHRTHKRRRSDLSRVSEANALVYTLG